LAICQQPNLLLLPMKGFRQKSLRCGCWMALAAARENADGIWLRFNGIWLTLLEFDWLAKP